MNKLVLVLAIVLVIGRVHGEPALPLATPTPFDVSRVDVTKISVAEIELTLEHKERLFDELLAILKDKNPAVINQLRGSLKSANDATIAAAKHAAELQQEKDEAVAAKEHLLVKLHLAKIIFSALVAAGIAFVVIRAPSTLSIYGGIALGAALIGGILVWL